jgi:hypothetical protein
MIDFSSAELGELVVHWVGNKLRDEKFKTFHELADVEEDDTKEHLLKYFLSPFKSTESYHFDHPTDISLNEIYAYSKRIFRDKDAFLDFSVEIAKHLYEQSTHPKVSGGELCVCLFHNVNHDNKKTTAIGIFKSENKEVFLKFQNKKDRFKISYDDGVSADKLEKGCLILNVDKEDGYKVMIVDTKKSVDAQYWKDQFLKLRPANDDFNHTKTFLSVTKDFVTTKMPDEFDVTKTDQIDLLNRSITYFKEHDNFDKKEFENEVLQDKGVIHSFRQFDKAYRHENSLSAADEFEISAQAVKKQSGIFKSVLKLDKNFHIYIHGDKELIEKGTEKDGRKFYKIYYDQER